MKTTLKYTSVSAALALMLTSQLSIAQNNEVDEIIVTSEKLGRTLTETTTSIEVLTGVELEERSIDELYEAVRRTANVAQSFGEKGFNIRGVDQRGAGSGSGLLINTTVDGASLPSNQATFFGPYSTWDVAQVEILRGPQGTTQGRNAIGGAILVNSADPEIGANLVKLRTSIADLGTYQLAGAANIDVSDQWALRFSVDKRGSDGWVDNPTLNTNYDARESTTVRGKALWQASDALSLKWTTNFTDSNGGEDLVDFLGFPSERINRSEINAFQGSEHVINTLQIDYDFNDAWSLTALATRYDHDYQRLDDFDATPAPVGSIDRTQEEESITTEIRFNYDNGGNFKGVFGAYYGDFDRQIEDFVQIPVTVTIPDRDLLRFFGIPLTSSIFRDRTTVANEENVAVFGEFEYAFNDRLTGIFGLRWDSENRTSNSIQEVTTDSPVFLLPLPPTQTEPLDSDFDALLPKLGVRYEVNDAVTLGFTAQSAYRAGGQSISAVTSTLANFDTETAWNYEASLRADISDTYSVSANVFYTDWTDQQVSRRTDVSIIGNFGSDTITINAGESSLYGAEISVDANWSDSLSAYVSLGLLETKFDDFVSGLVDNTGNEFAFAPNTNITLGVNYRTENGFVAIADINWRDDQFSNNSNDLDSVIDGYALANVKLGYEQDSWSVYVFARNLLDEDYTTQIQPAIRDRNGNIATQLARTGEPRLAGIEFNYHWGK